jgi:uncharacterized repeat protein (TIGR01451 family)
MASELTAGLPRWNRGQFVTVPGLLPSLLSRADTMFSFFFWLKRQKNPLSRPRRSRRWAARPRRGRLGLEQLETRLAPANSLTATLAVSPTTANRGDTLSYTAVLTNNSGATATGVQYSDTLDANTTLVSGSLHASPIANNDTYNWVGNTTLSSAAVGRPGLFANDTAPLGEAIHLVSNTNPAHGSVTINADGSFVYTPTANTTHVTSDSFTYTINNTAIAGATSTATVTINFAGSVWYVDNSLASNGTGTIASKFNSLASAVSAATTGDTIFLYKGSANYGAITLTANQKLIGQGVDLTFDDGAGIVTLVAKGSGNTPTVGGTVTLANNNTVEGLNISSGASTGLSGSSVSGETVSQVSVTSTTGTAVSLSTVGGNFTFTSISANGALHGISLSTTTGSFTVTGDGASDPANTTRGRTTAKLGGGTITLGSGGTIQSCTGSGVVLSSAANVTLRNMVIQNNGSGIKTGTDGMTVTNGSNLTLDNTVISGSSGNNGLHATGLSGLTFEHCEIHDNATNSGVAGGTEAWNVRLDEVTGTVTVDNSHLYNSYAMVMGTVNHTTTSIAIYVTNSTFDGGSINNGSSLLAQAFDTASLILSFTGSTSNNGRNGEGVDANYNNSSTGSFTVLNSSFDNNGVDNGGGADINVASTKGNVTFDIENNTTRMNTTVPAGGNAGTSISADLAGTANSTSVLQGKMLNNSVGNASVANSASTAGAGIAVQANAGIMTVDISGNTVSQSGSEGFAILASGVSAALTATINVTLHNNSATVTNNVNAADGLSLTAGGGGFADTVNANVSGNVKFDASNNVNAIGGVNAVALGGATINLQGYSGAANDTTALTTFLNGVATTVNPTSSVLIGTTPQATIKGTSSVLTPTGTFGAISLTPTTLSAATVGVSYTPVNVTASGGTAPYTFSIYAGALPPGMTLASGGTLSGTPTAGGTFAFAVRATDSASHAGFRTYTLTVNSPTITLGPASLAGGTVGAAYSQTISASGSTTPFHFTISSGSLPPGLFLNQDTGVISGVPTTTSGSPFNFTVQATDSSTGTGPFSATKSYSISVANPTVSLSGINVGSLPNGAGNNTETIVYQATINNPLTSPADAIKFTTQGTVTGTFTGSPIVTDDPNTAAPNDATVVHLIPTVTSSTANLAAK